MGGAEVSSAWPHTPLQMTENYLFDHRDEGCRLLLALGAKRRVVFPGAPEIHDGCMWPNERPGLGVDLDEQAAAKYPYPEHRYNGAWAPIRRADGTVIRP